MLLLAGAIFFFFLLFLLFSQQMVLLPAARPCENFSLVLAAIRSGFAGLFFSAPLPSCSSRSIPRCVKTGSSPRRPSPPLNRWMGSVLGTPFFPETDRPLLKPVGPLFDRMAGRTLFSSPGRTGRPSARPGFFFSCRRFEFFKKTLQTLPLVLFRFTMTFRLFSSVPY